VCAKRNIESPGGRAIIAKVDFRIRVAWLLGMLGLAGCGGQSVEQPPNPTEDRLLKIGDAYLKAAGRLKRPPRTFEEIKPGLEGAVAADFLRSPNDGEPFAIIWGVNYNTLPPGGSDPFTVAAYEKNGVGGKRYVLRFPKSVVSLTDEEFRKAVFPPGHKAPP
jgi:hypothetical protein